MKEEDKGRGAEHIKMHLGNGAEGEITLEEVAKSRKLYKRVSKKF